MPVRMKDIADDLGVSVVTVSKVLRNHADISAGTKDRVLRRARELNYRPNLAARALVTGRSMIIGLVVPDLVHPFFAQVGKGLSALLRQQGYGVVIASSEENAEFERQEIEQLLARRVDALIVASAESSAAAFASIDEHRIPYILIDRRPEGFDANFVGTDDLAAGRIATEHLIGIGCRMVAHIRGPEVSTALGRLAGYRCALARCGRPVLDDYIAARQQGDDTGDKTGYEAMKALLRLHPRPDGVFCYNDPTAMGAMKGILEAGLRIPEDIAVVGCGNLQYADFLRVPLTTIEQGSEAIGTRAAELALALINSKKPPSPKSIVLDPTLVVRASTTRRGSEDIY